MNSVMYNYYQELGKTLDLEGPYLEVGAAPGGKAILAGPTYDGLPERYAINLTAYEQRDGIEFVKCNSNDMSEVFKSNRFGTIFSNAVLEHDKYFWRSLAEMRRVLKPEGHLVLGAPGFVEVEKLANKVSDALGEFGKHMTVTYVPHARPDYWRFSSQAFRQVVCEGLNVVQLESVGLVPRLVVVGQKPASDHSSTRTRSQLEQKARTLLVRVGSRLTRLE